MTGFDRLRRFCPPLIVLFLVQGCGGGGGDSGARPPVTVPPTATPTPTPATTPTPTPAALVPPAPFGLTTSQVFAPLGWIKPAGASEPVLIGDGSVPFGWSQALGTYELTLPDAGSGRLNYTFPGNNPLAFSLVGANGQTLTNGIALNDGRFYDPAMLSTGILIWLRAKDKPGPDVIHFAFGLRSSASDIPASGRRKFLTFQESSGGTLLDIDFGARTIGGFHGLAWVDDWGPYADTRYSLTSVAFAPDGRSFSARFIIPDAPSEGQLFGQFMGPGANEIAVVHKGWIKNPYDDKWEITYGVRVGRICSDC